MSDANRLLFLRIALIIIGLTFIFGIYTLGIVWPSGWAWGQGHSHCLMMIIGVYATLGVFLIIASRNPYAHKSLIWFTIWSSAVHAAIMGVQSIQDTGERGHISYQMTALGRIAEGLNPHDRRVNHARPYGEPDEALVSVGIS